MSQRPTESFTDIVQRLKAKGLVTDCTTDPTMPANAPAGSDSSEREALAERLKELGHDV